MKTNTTSAERKPAPNSEMLDTVLDGLSRPVKRLPSKYFYDQRGSELFERICEQPEYYLTRTEIGIMRAHGADMAACIDRDALLIEYGSGSSVKTRLLLDQLVQKARLAGYAPVDVSREHLMAASGAIARDYPGLPVHPICADFTTTFALPAVARMARRVVYFPGSTIGNFAAPEATALLARIAGQIAGNTSHMGGALIGIDLQKSEAVLSAAYNDAQGVTAAFNRNVLEHINRELGGDFDLTRFAHRAFYNAQRGCVEMHLESLAAQEVSVAGRCFTLAAGERIHTEDSHKYTQPGFASMAEQAGLAMRRSWTDEDARFAVVYVQPRRDGRAGSR
jgi:dimethylhistidine N-methyltransferase